mmetsp:Transcript_19842/g.35913  ORF Transcript_19842/g.35913 Transcript_19842/m.35913 type:complete len:785 (+) Transcript_19842:47-2401(+)
MSKSAAKPVEGVEFPKDAEGNRPTMGINKATFAAAMRAVDKAAAAQVDELPDKKWRRGYQKHLVDHVRCCAQSTGNALNIAQAGLDYLQNTMVFVRPAGDDAAPVSVRTAMAKFTSSKFKTFEVQGSGPISSGYSVQYKPYGTPGTFKELSGDALHKQVDTWVRNGTIEMSCGNAIDKVAENPDWCKLQDLYIVLFGASSAMGPFYKLMDHGANVIALDLDRPQIWEKLLRETRNRAGKLIFPVKEDVAKGASDAEIAKVAGCNLLTDTPEIRTWLQELYPSERLVCMALAYLDGAMFVKVSVAMDAIIESLTAARGADKVGLAYLCTPTDVHLCTSPAVEAAKANLRKAPAWQGLLAPLLSKFGKPMRKNVEKPIIDAEGNPVEGLHIVDCVIPEQGPNYILAKRLQHWRAMVSVSAGCIVSSNIAPSTATASVLSNVLFALGYKGMSYFRPMEITYQETSNSVMAALLIRDLRDPTSLSHPTTPRRNPLCLFSEGSFHGGCWRGAWKFASVGAPAVVGYVFSAFVAASYLLLYSLYQGAGWSKILVGVLKGWSRTSLWTEVGPAVTFFQHLGLLEVAHAAVGLTRSNAFMTLVQIFSRIFVVALLNECPDVSKGTPFWVPMMLLAWSLADATRYIFYAVGQLRDIATSAKGVAVAMKLMKVKSVERADDPVFQMPFPLVWLRYSLFLVLYPMGVSGECLCVWTGVHCLTVEASGAMATGSAWVLQNLRFVFHSVGLQTEAALLGAIYSIYALGLPALYLMLLGARKKNLGKPAADKKKKKAQ